VAMGQEQFGNPGLGTTVANCYPRTGKGQQIKRTQVRVVNCTVRDTESDYRL
jgi:hypothetical protein